MQNCQILCDYLKLPRKIIRPPSYVSSFISFPFKSFEFPFKKHMTQIEHLISFYAHIIWIFIVKVCILHAFSILQYRSSIVKINSFLPLRVKTCSRWSIRNVYTGGRLSVVRIRWNTDFKNRNCLISSIRVFTLMIKVRSWWGCGWYSDGAGLRQPRQCCSCEASAPCRRLCHLSWGEQNKLKRISYQKYWSGNLLDFDLAGVSF